MTPPNKNQFKNHTFTPSFNLKVKLSEDFSYSISSCSLTYFNISENNSFVINISIFPIRFL